MSSLPPWLQGDLSDLSDSDSENSTPSPLRPPRTPSPKPQVPPRSSGLKTTPVQYKASGTDRFASTQEGEPAHTRYERNADEAHLRFIGAMPPELFLKQCTSASHLPPRPATATLSAIPSDTEEVYGDENILIYAAERGKICPHIKLFDATDVHSPFDTIDRRSDIRGVDLDFLTAYCKTKAENDAVLKNLRRQPARQSKLKGVPAPAPFEQEKLKDILPVWADLWSWTEIWKELKPPGQDGFVDPSTKMGSEERKSFVWEHQSKSGIHTRGQMFEYAAAIFASQHRVFFFSVLVMKDEARILRWDRAGVVVTEAFNWRETAFLAEFLWRFDHMSPEERGYDMTVCCDPPLVEISKARAAFQAMEPCVIQEDEMLNKVFVYDEETKTFHGLIIGRPQIWSRSMFGRGTTGYYAFDPERNAVVWLKDCWRIDDPAFPKEDTVYDKLKEKNIPHTARKLYAGDVVGQATRSHEFVSADWACKTSGNIDKLVHYRIVLDTVGRPISAFKSTRQLCQVVRDCIYAHWQVYKLLSILHRDVNPGNILIDNKGRGLLVDWDLSRDVSNPSLVVARRELRSGSWQFSSAMLAKGGGTIPHLYCHDLESFVHVVVFNLFRYRPSDYSLGSLIVDLQGIYDEHRVNGTIILGGDQRGDVFALGRMLRTTKIKELHPSCVQLVNTIRGFFSAAFYNEDTSVERRNAALESLKTSSTILQAFDTALADEEWKDDDGSSSIDQLRYSPLVPRTIVEASIPDNKRKVTTDRLWTDVDFLPRPEGSNAKKQRHLSKLARGSVSAVTLSGLGSAMDD
ncbi:hypothetical protein OF83DRAFT_1082844 [Amylostereum chailletii]|nr:hypothetical protein OF83DRAFT_1082844 [Amylostereum chailletii]